MNEHSLCNTDDVDHEVQHMRQDANAWNQPRPVFQPRVDLIDSGDAVTLWADLPGVDETTLDISVEHNTLTLKAQVPPVSFEGMKPVAREFATGDYERTFTISDEIDREAIDAVVIQGVLKLTLPKTKHAALRKVSVKAG